MKPILLLVAMLGLLFGSSALQAASHSSQASPALRAEIPGSAPADSNLGKSTVAGPFAKVKRWWREWRDRLIYPRGWFFICLGIGGALLAGAFLAAEIAVLSTVLVVAAITAGILAMYFLAMWIGYHWRY